MLDMLSNDQLNDILVKCNELKPMQQIVSIRNMADNAEIGIIFDILIKSNGALDFAKYRIFSKC